MRFPDRYYVRNIGHEAAEFERDPRYYVENYANKPKLGVSGWQARIEQHRKRSKVARASLALPNRPPLPEKTWQAVNGQPARLWSMFDGFTAEVEVLDLLMALARLVKPAHVIETGTWLGLSSCAIARGLVANGFGRLTTLEINPDVHWATRETIVHYGFAAIVDARLISSSAFLWLRLKKTTLPAGMARECWL